MADNLLDVVDKADEEDLDDIVRKSQLVVMIEIENELLIVSVHEDVCVVCVVMLDVFDEPKPRSVRSLTHLQAAVLKIYSADLGDELQHFLYYLVQYIVDVAHLVKKQIVRYLAYLTR